MYSSYFRSVDPILKRLVPLVLGLVLVVLYLVANSSLSPSRSTANTQVWESYGQLPLRFEANMGQTNDSVAFLARDGSYSVFLTPDEIVLNLNEPTVDNDAIDTDVVRLRLAGASPEPFLNGEEPLPGVVNYILGDDPADWHTNIPTFGAVRYANVYSGIDLLFYGNQGRLEYDFVVSPGANPDLIRLDFEGATDTTIDDTGNLILETGNGKIVQQIPTIYQVVGGEQRLINGGYRLLGEGQVAFHLGEYNPTLPLVIDPVLVYSTYYGGSGEDSALGVAADLNGNTYIAGETHSVDFPNAGGAQPIFGGGTKDVFIAKLDSSGTTVLYTTYLGGSSNDRGFAIDVDAAGNAFVTGDTRSLDFPTANPIQAAHGGGPNTEDAFVSRLDSSGSLLVYSTYLGGLCDDSGFGIVVDAASNAFVTGQTGNCFANNFPTINAFDPTYASSFDVFLTELNQTGSTILYSTYLGGTSFDQGQDVDVDATGLVYLTGMTQSTAFPTTGNAFQPALSSAFLDAFVTVLDISSNTLVYSTFLGGSNSDQGQGVAAGPLGKVYVSGRTKSSDFPTAAPLQPALSGDEDAFVAKIDPSLSGVTSVVYATYLGGTGSDKGLALEVNNAGEVFITGESSSNFPLVDPPPAAPTSGVGFLSKLNAAGSALIYSTYIGPRAGLAIDIDLQDNVYVSGSTPFSSLLPLVNPIQSVGNGSTDAFVMKIAPFGPTPTDTPTPTPMTAQFLVIDEDSIGKDNPPNFFSEGDVNADIADIGLRTQLPFFAANVGNTIALHTGEVGDEGWFALKTIPVSWEAAGPTADGLRNYLSAGPGLGTPDANGDREALLDKVPDITPLRATGLKLLEGIQVCALAYAGDLSVNIDYHEERRRISGSLKGSNLGMVAFEVISVTQLTGFSSSSLPQVEIRILDADEVCGEGLELFIDAPETISSSEPFDIEP